MCVGVEGGEGRIVGVAAVTLGEPIIDSVLYMRVVSVKTIW